MKIDKKIIKELTDYLNEFNLTEIEYTDKDTKIKVSKSISSNSNQAVNVAASAPISNVEKVKIIHKRQGIQRFLQQNFFMNPTSFLCRAIALILSPFVPGKLIGHMIIAVAVKV